MFQLLLFLHVIGAIAVFGPVYVFPLIVSEGRKNPQHFPFAAILTEVIPRRVVVPGAVVQGITGVLLILNTGRDLTLSVNRWLVAGIILYLITISIAAFVQAKNAEAMVRLLSAGPPPGPPPAGAPAGPPPEITELGKKVQRTGMLLTGLITLIVLLMVTKPAF